MKVILNKKVDGLGGEGDVITVKDGFARNYLFPRGIAKNATKNNIAVIQREIEDRQVREAKPVKIWKLLLNSWINFPLNLS